MSTSTSCCPQLCDSKATEIVHSEILFLYFDPCEISKNVPTANQWVTLSICLPSFFSSTWNLSAKLKWDCHTNPRHFSVEIRQKNNALWIFQTHSFKLYSCSLNRNPASTPWTEPAAGGSKRAGGSQPGPGAWGSTGGFRAWRTHCAGGGHTREDKEMATRVPLNLRMINYMLGWK